jgi:hypothetical protein
MSLNTSLARPAVRAVGGRKYWAIKSRQMSWTQRKTEPRIQTLSVFHRRDHFAAVVGMDLVLNDLLSPPSTARASKHLCIVPVAEDPSAAISLKIHLGASAPNYKRGWASLIPPQRVQRALQRMGFAKHSQGQEQM